MEDFFEIRYLGRYVNHVTLNLLFLMVWSCWFYGDLENQGIFTDSAFDLTKLLTYFQYHENLIMRLYLMKWYISNQSGGKVLGLD